MESSWEGLVVTAMLGFLKVAVVEDILAAIGEFDGTTCLVLSWQGASRLFAVGSSCSC